MAMRMAVIALRNAAAARMNTSSAIRLTQSSRSLRVIELASRRAWLGSTSSVKPPELHRKAFLLLKRRSRILRQLVLTGVRALNFEFVEEQRRANYGCWNATAAVADERVVAHGDEIAPQRTDIKLIENSAADQFLVAIRVHAIQETPCIRPAQRINALGVWLALLSDHLQHFLLGLRLRLRC